MKRYIDSYVVPVKKTKIKAYQKLAKKAAKVWIEHGALQYFEAVGEDLKKHPWCMSYPELVKPKKGETIVVASITYKSRAQRDRVNKKVMADPRMHPDDWDPKKMPFDCDRMVFGGFETIVFE